MSDDVNKVSLFVVTRVPHRGLVVIFQGRGEHNFETGKSESFPHCLQSTVSGGIGLNETPIEAVRREAYEELGRVFSGLVGEAIRNNFLKKLSRVKGSRTVAFVLYMPYGDVAKIRLHASSGGLRFFKLKNYKRIHPVVKEQHRELGPKMFSDMVMFADDIAAVREMSELFYAKKR